MTWLDRTSRLIDQALLAIGCVFLFVMMLHITVDVLARALFNFGIIGTLETVSYYHMVLAVLLPLAFVERTGENIRVDVLVQQAPVRLQLAFYVVACLVGLAFFGALTWQGALDAWQSTVREETIMSNFLFYIWPSRWALPIAFGATWLATLNNLVQALARRQPL
jgi:TRAP-type C4-dicarboxylate transport system permease small subunit